MSRLRNTLVSKLYETLLEVVVQQAGNIYKGQLDRRKELDAAKYMKE